jgi:hypothetical protein
VHAYLGLDPIAEALREGADVVLTGRVADSALFAAPVAARRDLDAAGVVAATTIGHLLECSGQLTGGNLADLRQPPLPAATYADLGFPLATVAADGSAELWVLPGKPARLDVVGCTLQLLYEVHDPRAYLTPDTSLDFSGIRFEQVGPNRVRVTGTAGAPRPERLKAVGFRQGREMVADMEIAYAGDGCVARARTAAETMTLRLQGLGLDRMRVDVVGLDSVLWEAAPARPNAPGPAEVRMHVSAVCATADLAQAVEDELYALTLSGPAGGCGMRSEKRPHVETRDGLIDRDLVQPTLVWAEG